VEGTPPPPLPPPPPPPHSPPLPPPSARRRERGVGYRRLGKLVVAASPGQLPALAALAARGSANGVGDLSLLSSAQAAALEPALACAGALLSPSTAVLDSHAYLAALLADATAAGAALALGAQAVGGRVEACGDKARGARAFA